jgi:hypothetical protein
MNSYDLEDPHLPMFAASGNGESSAGARREKPMLAEQLLALLDQIRAMHKTMDGAEWLR